jgi:hypothetical protein
MSKAVHTQRPLFDPWLDWYQLPESVREQALDVLTALYLEIVDGSFISEQNGHNPSGTQSTQSPPHQHPPTKAPVVLRECAICQSSIHPSEQIWTCPKCSLVYHAECWQSNMGCASYGCEQVNTLAPKSSEVLPTIVGSTFATWKEFREWYQAAVEGFTVPVAPFFGALGPAVGAGLTPCSVVPGCSGLAVASTSRHRTRKLWT